MASAEGTVEKTPSIAEKAPDVVSKWGAAVAKNGFTQLPAYLVFLNQYTDPEHRLSPVELMTLFQLVATWWKKDEAPYPSIKTLALRTGVSERQMQRAINTLEQKNLIKRVKKKGKGIISANAYDLSPLVETLNSAADLHDTPYKRKLKGASDGDKPRKVRRDNSDIV